MDYCWSDDCTSQSPCCVHEDWLYTDDFALKYIVFTEPKPSSLVDKDFYVDLSNDEEIRKQTLNKGLFCTKFIEKGKTLMISDNLAIMCNDAAARGVDKLKDGSFEAWCAFLTAYYKNNMSHCNLALGINKQKECVLVARCDIPPHTELMRVYGHLNWFSLLPRTEGAAKALDILSFMTPKEHPDYSIIQRLKTQEEI